MVCGRLWLEPLSILQGLGIALCPLGRVPTARSARSVSSSLSVASCQPAALVAASWNLGTAFQPQGMWESGVLGAAVVEVGSPSLSVLSCGLPLCLCRLTTSEPSPQGVQTLNAHPFTARPGIGFPGDMGCEEWAGTRIKLGFSRKREGALERQ